MKKICFSKKVLSILLSLLLLFSAFAGLKGAPIGYAENTKGGGGDGDLPSPQETINWDLVNAVIEAIHNIGKVEFTYECQAVITAARDAYDALNSREKQEVSNYGDLTDSESAFLNLARGHNTAVRFIVNGAIDGILDTHANRVYFGNYSQQPNADPGPVLWRMLDHKDGRMLLLSDKILAVKPYHISAFVTVPWTTCSLRTWLNGSESTLSGETDDSFFNNAFNMAEQTTVRDTDVNYILSSGGTGQGTTGGENNDKVFILSRAEVLEPTFGFPESTGVSETRITEPTQFALATYGQTDNPFSWWLRDTDAGTSRWVHNDGQVISSSGTGFYNQGDPRGIRPALYADLSRVLFASPAAGGKNALGALATIPVYTGKEWKLTVRNNSYRFSVSDTEATAGRGETVTLNYTKAKYDTNDWISAILVNADGNPVYYGQIAQATSAAGLVDITIPQDITPGNYTLRVFNEQLNGDYATDSASAFSDVALTVSCPHNWRQSSESDSCETGLTYGYTCTICGATKKETERAPGHLWGEPVWSWSEDFVPVLTFTCERCGNTATPEVTVTSEVTAEPAVGQEGEKVYTASAVFEGETYTDTATEILLADAPVGAHSLTLDGRIGVNFYIGIPDPDSFAIVRFTVGDDVSYAVIDPEEFTTAGETKLWKFTCEVAASQIDTQITGVLTVEGADCNPFTYSVQEYLTELMYDPGLNTDQNLMNLASATATYGYYANELFAMNPDFTQHELFDDSGMAYVTASAIQEYEAQINDTADGVSYYGSSLVLRTRTAIKHYFTLPADKTLDDFTFCLAEGTEWISIPVFQSGSLYFVEIQDIPSGELGNMQTLTVLDREDNVVNSWTYSALSYVYKALTKSEENDPAVSAELADVSRALVLYYRAADAYFSAQTISFYLVNNFGWVEGYAYAWDENGDSLLGEFPGQAAETTVNDYGETMFIVNLPANAIGCLVSNGRDSQTEDITDFSYDGYWMDGTKNDMGHYTVTGWNY